jgi:hypothetical protein
MGGADGERGGVLVLVLVVSILLMGILTTAVSASNYSGTLTTHYSDTSQASLAAQSGLAVELSAMRNTSLYTSLPCGSFSGSLTVPGASSSYSGTVTYYPSGSNPTALTCAGATLGGSTAPATATIVSTGTAPPGLPVTMVEQIAVATTSTPAAALGYALYTSNALNLTGAAALSNSTGNTANVYSGSTMTCGNGDVVPGSVTTYAAVNFTGSCTIGGLTASGTVTLGNSATVKGNLISYTGPLSMSGSAKVTGTATETNGNATLAGSASVVGTLYASGTITLGGGSTAGAQVPNDLVLSTQTMPAAVSFPVLNPSVATWQGQGWNVVQIPGTVNGTAYTCATYFQSNSSGSPDPFQSAIAALTAKTVFYAPTCAPSYTRTQAFNFAADTVLQVQSYTTANSDTYQSTTAAHHDFSILASAGTACSTANVDVSVSNSSNFASSLSVLIYSPGQVSYANAPSMTGQIVACGGITGSNSFALTFDPQASAEIPGSSSATAPTVSVTNKYYS